MRLLSIAVLLLFSSVASADIPYQCAPNMPQYNCPPPQVPQVYSYAIVGPYGNVIGYRYGRGAIFAYFGRAFTGRYLIPTK